MPGWPSIRLKVPDSRRQRQSIPIDSFPPPLRQEFAAYIESLRVTDLFAEEAAQKALAPSTVQQRAAELGLALSALVASGRDAAGITSLAMLVEPEAFKTIVRHYLKEDGTARPFARNIAQTLVTLARRWVRVDSAALDQLCAWQRRLGYQKGFTEKNRILINTLDDPRRASEAALLAGAPCALGGTHDTGPRCHCISARRCNRDPPERAAPN